MTALESMELSTRAHNALMASLPPEISSTDDTGILIAELKRLGPEGLLAFRNFGKRSLREIEAALDAYENPGDPEFDWARARPIRTPTANRTRKWDERWMAVAALVATWSKDPSRGIGCVVVGPDNEQRVQGYNGFPRGVVDDVPERRERPTKYLWTEHAERNALYNAARVGTPLKGCTLYSTLATCADCTRGIVQVGIVRVVMPKPDFSDPQWGAGFAVAIEMYREAGVTVEFQP